jgi:hypothetical protein
VTDDAGDNDGVGDEIGDEDDGADGGDDIRLTVVASRFFSERTRPQSPNRFPFLFHCFAFFILDEKPFSLIMVPSPTHAETVGVNRR